MKFGAILLLRSLAGCATQNTLIGNCGIPPNKSEGYTLVSCSADPADFSNLGCYYAKPMPYGIELQEVTTKGCTGFQITGQGIMLK